MGTMNFLKGKIDEAVVQARDVAGQARLRAGGFAAEHSGTAGGAIDKAAHFVNQRTDGRYADTVVRVSGVARKGVDRAAEQGPPLEGGGTRMSGGTASTGTTMTGPAR